MNVQNDVDSFEAVENSPADHPVRQLPVGSDEYNAEVAKLQKGNAAETVPQDEDLDTTAGDEDDQVEDSDEAEDDEDAHEERDEDEGKPRSLKRKLARAKQEAREAKAELERMRNEPKKAAPQLGDPPPNPDDYQTHAAFVDATMDWKLDQRELAKQAQAKSTEVKTNWDTKEAAFREEAVDYDKIVTPAKVTKLGMTQDHFAVLAESEYGPQIAYALMKDPALMEKFTSSSVHRQIALLGKLESQFEDGETPVSTASTKVSAAPPPRFPKGYAKTKMDPIKDVLEMDDSTWFRTMDAIDRDKRRR